MAEHSPTKNEKPGIPAPRPVEGAKQGADKGSQEDRNGTFLPVAAAPAPKKPRRWVKPLLLGLGIVALAIGIPWGLSYWRYARTHVSTDDAYVTGNLVNVSPIISGT